VPKVQIENVDEFGGSLAGGAIAGVVGGVQRGAAAGARAGAQIGQVAETGVEKALQVVGGVGADKRRIVWVSAPGDYATFNSNHTPDGTKSPAEPPDGPSWPLGRFFDCARGLLNQT
jgi:hypothetical protein